MEDEMKAQDGGVVEVSRTELPNGARSGSGWCDGRMEFVDDARRMSGCNDAMLVIDSDECMDNAYELLVDTLTDATRIVHHIRINCLVRL
jgi:hypothetical protein